MSKKPSEDSLPHCALCGKEIPLHELVIKRVATVELFYHEHCSRTGQQCVLTTFGGEIFREQVLTDFRRKELNRGLCVANSPRRWMVKS